MASKRQRSAGKRTRTRAAAPTPFFPPSVVAAKAYYFARLEAEQDAEREALAAAQRRSKENLNLATHLKELRYYTHGWEPSNGYSLSSINKWSEKKRQKVLERGKQLRDVIATPHAVFSIPRSKQKRAALERLTRQNSKVVKRFIIHTEEPERTKILFDKNNRVTIRINYGAGKKPFDRKLFLWNDYTKRAPVTLQAQRRVLKKMMPDLPSGNYVFWSENHGPVGVSQSKEFIQQKLNDWYLAYEPPSRFSHLHQGFGRTIIGVAYVGDGRRARAFNSKISKMRREREKSSFMFAREQRNKARAMARRLVAALAKQRKKKKKKKKKKKAKHK